MGDPFFILRLDSLVGNCLEDTFVEAVVLWEREGEGDTLGELNFGSQVLDSEGELGDLCGLEWRD